MNKKSNIENELINSMIQDLSGEKDSTENIITTAMNKISESALIFKNMNMLNEHNALMDVIYTAKEASKLRPSLKTVIADINSAFDQLSLDIDFADDLIDLNLTDDELAELEDVVLNEVELEDMDFEDESD